MVTIDQNFETKDQMIVDLGIKCLQEGFEYQTHRSTKDRYEALCVNDGCEWHFTARTYRPQDIVDDVNEKFGLNIGYATGWRARWNALSLIRGSHSESFTRLPTYLYNLEITNPGTRTAIKVDPSGRFEECFVALGVAIDTFLQNLRRVLIIDAAHLKGPYLGTMFLVVAMDGNNNIVPIAFGVAVPAGAQLMEEVGVDRWSRAHFPGIRYNIMTSNSAESINAMSRFARRLPIVGLIEYFRAFQQKWYFLRRAYADALQHPLTEWAQKKIWKRIRKSATWTVQGIGHNIWEVNDHRRDAKVDMSRGICDRRQWQMSGLPCGHAIAVAKAIDLRDVSQLVPVPYYKTDNYKATYSGLIYPVGPPNTWQSPEVPLRTVLPPIVKKRRVGRPSVNARRPSHGEGSSQRKCPRCNENGHKSDTCPLFPSSASGSSQRSTLEPHGTIVFDSLDQEIRFD
ncbi:hypothetical protein OSB04_016359 [Centaurea solstitialis]|uniref:Zinc finger PMZ-type domain-containing protein n=1 Tax=Centaurea solstitialis TaxID=347529 RepID=A0AA38T0S8_9ASTR|nr:hypothetical protein OSB04_016359 [Centaurea solstitialis]